MDYLILFGKSLFFYLFITIGFRLMGKREIGELSIIDFIVSIFIAELAAISIENYKDSMLFSIIPISTLIIIQIITAKISLKSSIFRDTLDGSPSVIINRGKVNFREMVKQRYNVNDLLSQLRSQSIKCIEDVDYAILESNGKLSIFEKSFNKDYPLPLILDGKVDDDVLLQIGKSRSWLDKRLEREGYKVEDIFYGFYKGHNLFLIKDENIK
ncbi:MAG: DUF421 domain-containing protein [Tenericutes bacterium]|nr:DUF421 domain-containing protein [Mycoplasmatota bacterium]